MQETVKQDHTCYCLNLFMYGICINVHYSTTIYMGNLIFTGYCCWQAWMNKRLYPAIVVTCEQMVAENDCFVSIRWLVPPLQRFPVRTPKDRSISFLLSQPYYELPEPEPSLIRVWEAWPDHPRFVSNWASPTVSWHITLDLAIPSCMCSDTR